MFLPYGAWYQVPWYWYQVLLASMFLCSRLVPVPTHSLPVPGTHSHVHARRLKVRLGLLASAVHRGRQRSGTRWCIYSNCKTKFTWYRMLLTYVSCALFVIWRTHKISFFVAAAANQTAFCDRRIFLIRSCVDLQLEYYQ